MLGRKAAITRVNTAKATILHDRLYLVCAKLEAVALGMHITCAERSGARHSGHAHIAAHADQQY